MRREGRSRSATVTTDVMLPAALALALVVGAGLPTSAWAAGPEETIRELVSAVSAVLNDPGLQGPAGKVERKNRVAGIIHGAFHFEDMARESLGTHWDQLGAAQREEFTRLFGELFEQSYSLLVLRFLGERTTTYHGESIDGNRAGVRTHLVSEKEGRLPVDYRMAALGERWAVVDVVVDGVSLAANYRAQFTKVIRTSSYETLLRRMRKHAG
jgi:phospholipid transport system substrate-binding protein